MVADERCQRQVGLPGLTQGVVDQGQPDQAVGLVAFLFEFTQGSFQFTFFASKPR